MQVKPNSAIESLQIVADADRLTSRAGTALLAGLADRLGLSGALSQAMRGVRRRRSRHDPGRTLRDLALMLVDGGDCLADLSALRDQPSLFGEVASDATAWRALAALADGRLPAVRKARATARERVWELAGAPRRVVLDLDATLITAHSDKERAAGNYKHGFGFHPLLAYEATTQEALAGILRPGNAGANTAPTTSSCSSSLSHSCPSRRSGRDCWCEPTRAGRRMRFSTTSLRAASASRSAST